MKTLKVLVLAVAFTFSGVLSASTEPSTATTTPAAKETSSVTQKVGKLLKNPYFDVNEDLSATVMLTVNHENEIVVLSVDSDDETLESFIKNRLNYEKLDANFDGKLKTYKIPVKVKSI